MYAPTAEDIERFPYDHPCHWIANETGIILDLGVFGTWEEQMDQIISPERGDGEVNSMTAAAFGLAVKKYSDAVLESDPVPDKSREAREVYREQHVVTRMTLRLDAWPSETVRQGPIVLAVAQGPFYAVALVLRGDGLYVQSHDLDGSSVRIA